MCSPKQPKAPDPKVVAQAQADANIRTAQGQTELNRYNETNPLGSQSWSRDPNNPNVYTLNTKYSPEVQSSLDSYLKNNALGQQGVTDLMGHVRNTLSQQAPKAPTANDANSIISEVDRRLYDNDPNVRKAMAVADQTTGLVGDQANRLKQLYGTEFNYNNAPAMPTADEQTRQAVADAIYSKATSRLDPRFQQRDNDLATQLASQGITQGSAAYDREMQNLGREKTDAYGQATNDATVGSLDAMQKLFGMQLGARQQGVEEANTLRTMPTNEALAASQIAGGANANAIGQHASEINRGNAVAGISNALFNLKNSAFDAGNRERSQAIDELNAIRSQTGAPIIPQFSSGAGGGAPVGQTPVADATYNSYQGLLNNYNAKVGSNNNMLSGLAGLGGAALMAPAGTFAGLASGGSAALAGLAAF